MTGPGVAVAAVRVAVRRDLERLVAEAAEGPVLVACSGGADSLALAAALAFEGPKLGRAVGAVIVDHGWSADSGSRSLALSDTLVSLGLEPVVIVDAHDAARTETTARELRYAAFDKVIAETGAAAVMLAHTGSDQAEQVLIALARGSGTRSLAGMPAVRGRYRRPLLAIERSQTEAACEALHLTPWSDPSNRDPRHLRARVRHELLPLMESVLGPGVESALLRTAALSRSDAEALDALAEDYCAHGPVDLSTTALARLAPAVLRRVLKRELEARGSQPNAEQLLSVQRLVSAWRGQGAVALPGGVQAERVGGRIVVSALAAPQSPEGPDARE